MIIHSDRDKDRDTDCDSEGFDYRFTACDADLDGQLDLSETKYACQASGLYPEFPEEIEKMVADLKLQFPLSKDNFTKLTQALEESSCRQGIPAIPYARRGLSLRQIKSIGEGLLKTKWLPEHCENFNDKHKDDIEKETNFEMTPNLYSMNESFVQATTATDRSKRNEIPEEVLKIIGVPSAPKATCCFAQLINPDGLEVDYFVSHYWGHPFERTVLALSNFAEGVYRKIGKKSADDIVFWICLFAINQHQAADEVGSSPEEGPFNVALARSKQGAVMILDGFAEPMNRIWCLYEIARAKDLNKSFQLITDEGDLGNASIKTMEDISKSLINLRASKAKASNQSDKDAIHYRIIDPGTDPGTIEDYKKNFSPYLDTSMDWFVQFDRHICKLIATPLLTAGMKAQSKDVCMRAIGMGAEVTVANLEVMKQQYNIDIKATVSHRDGTSGLAHIFALTGKVDLLKYVLDAGVDINEKDNGDWTPLHYAAEGGYLDICEVLINGGAKINELEDTGMTPLDWAVVYEHPDVCNLLREYGGHEGESSGSSSSGYGSSSSE